MMYFRNAVLHVAVAEMINFPNIACCLIIRTNHLSEPPPVLISSDNRRSTALYEVMKIN